VQLGCGVSLPGMLAAKCGANVTLSDGEQFGSVLENCMHACTRNDIDCKLLSLTWGNISQNMHALESQHFDLIIGADVLFEPSRMLCVLHEALILWQSVTIFCIAFSSPLTACS
jgi:methyltransferase-like protein 23